jgi:hypothetical protein
VTRLGGSMRPNVTWVGLKGSSESLIHVTILVKAGVRDFEHGHAGGQVEDHTLCCLHAHSTPNDPRADRGQFVPWGMVGAV